MKAELVIKSNAVFDSVGDAPFKGGVAISGNKIVAVRKDDGIDEFIGPDTRVYEYEDKLVMPGLVDGHDHLWWGAVAASDHMVDITSSTCEAEACEMIKAYADSHPDEKCIRGFGWFPSTWNNAPLPTKESLDAIVPDRPVYMICADAHSIWMNTLGLEVAGYRADMKFKHGSLSLDEKGQMAGVALEPEAEELAWNILYAFPPEEIKEIVDNFMNGLAAQGVTAISEMSADPYEQMYHDRYSVFRDMSKAGEFKSRVFAYTKFFGITDFDIVKEWQKEFESPCFRINGVKGFLDGVTSTYTGFLLEPYEDRPDTKGEPLIDLEVLKDQVTAANAAGFPARIHCIGDAAVRGGLDAFEASLERNGQHGLVNTVEHIESIHPDDIPRFAQLGVIPSMQGEHLPQEDNEKPIRIGEARARWEWAFKSILEAGGKLAFGTDFPVVFYNQFVGIHAAVARENYDGSYAGVVNHEEITLAQALKANTQGSGYVYMPGGEIGTLEEGTLADVIVLDRDLFTRPVSEIKEAKVELTVFDGKVVYEA